MGNTTWQSDMCVWLHGSWPVMMLLLTTAQAWGDCHDLQTVSGGHKNLSSDCTFL